MHGLWGVVITCTSVANRNLKLINHKLNTSKFWWLCLIMKHLLVPTSVANRNLHVINQTQSRSSPCTHASLRNQVHVQCNLDYPDLVYPDPRLSGLAGDQKVHYHACAEGVASDLLWVWSQVERWATDSADLPWAKLAY